MQKRSSQAKAKYFTITFHKQEERKMDERKITVESVLIRCRISGNPELIAIANAMLSFKIIETRRVPTAATDGVVMLFNPDFIASLTWAEIYGLLVHELLHVRLHHNQRFLNSHFSDHDVANRAMDDEINPLVQDAGYTLPSGGCFPDDHESEDGLSWESYYPKRLAMKEAPNEQKEKEDSEKPDPSPDEEDGGTDPVESGEADGGAGEENGEQQGEQQGETASEGEMPQPAGDARLTADGADAGCEQVASGCHGAGTLVADFAPELVGGKETMEETSSANAEAVEVALRETGVEEAVEEAESVRSPDGNATVDRSNDEPVLLKPAEGDRWQDVVIETFRRQSPESKVDWGRRSRRMQPNSRAYIPARRKINGLSIALVVDVSGSCTQWFSLWQSLANELVEEVENITRIEVVYHHHVHCFTDTWNRGDGEIELECNQSGGTCHKEALAEVETLDVDAIIQFTDNETYWPETFPEQDCITVRCPYSRELCPFGVNVDATIQ
jgi:predicted metal-dependent peptidase